MLANKKNTGLVMHNFVGRMDGQGTAANGEVAHFFRPV